MALVNKGELLGRPDKDLVLETSGRLYIKVRDRYYELDFKNLSQGKITGTVVNNITNEITQTETVDLSNYVTNNSLKKILKNYVNNKSWEEVLAVKEALENLQLDDFTESIKPISVQTMQVAVGSEQLQYEFVKSATDMEVVDSPIIMEEGDLIWNPITTPYIKHYTINGPDKIQPNLSYREFSRWSIMNSEGLNEREVLSFNGDTNYIYFKVSKNSNSIDDPKLGNGYLVYGNEPRECGPIEEEDGEYYYLLYAIVTDCMSGEPTITTMNGFTEITPGQIRAYIFSSPDGDSYINLQNGSIKLGDKLSYNTDGHEDQLILKGTLIQTGNGEISHIGAWCGEFDETRQYATGDEVSYTKDGTVSTYRYINDESSAGHLPTETDYWKIIAEGKKGTAAATPYRGDWNESSTYYGYNIRRDIVRYNNLYYIAKDAEHNGFSGISPEDIDYWESFGANFESVATKLAYIDDLIVKRLNTAGEGSSTKRIVAEGNTLSMFDDNNEKRLNISGDFLSDSEQMSSSIQVPMENIYSFSGDFPTTEINKGVFLEEGICNHTFTVGPSNIVKFTIPTITCQVEYRNMITIEANIECLLYSIIDGTESLIETRSLKLNNNGYSGEGSSSIIFTPSYSYQRSFTSGEHTISYKIKFLGAGDCTENEGHMDLYARHDGFIIDISYSTQIVEIGSNGFRAMMGSDDMAAFYKSSDGTPIFMLRAGSGDDARGVKVESGLLKILLGNNAYSLNVDSAGNVKATKVNNW